MELHVKVHRRYVGYLCVDPAPSLTDTHAHNPARAGSYGNCSMATTNDDDGIISYLGEDTDNACYINCPVNECINCAGDLSNANGLPHHSALPPNHHRSSSHPPIHPPTSGVRRRL